MTRILDLQKIVYSLGGRPLLNQAELTVSDGEKLCLVGRNGSGKSTLLRIASGELLPDSGERFVQPGTKIVYLPQDPDVTHYATAFDYAVQDLTPESYHQARRALVNLGLTGNEKTLHLSGGETRRCALARALASRPDLLLFDEPTNHLDMPTIEWLEKELITLSAAVIVISHDRRFLGTLARSVVWLDRGVTKRLDHGFGQFEKWRDELISQEIVSTHKLDRKIAREEDWMRYGVTARRKRNVRRVAELASLRQQFRERLQATPGTLKVQSLQSLPSGKLALVADGISKYYEKNAIVKGLSLRLLAGHKLAIVGANGVGKSTLIRLLTQQDLPEEGTVDIGPSTKFAALDQKRTNLTHDVSLVDTLTGGRGDFVQVGDEQRHVMSYLKDFLFRPEQASTMVGNLSGGERGRLALAQIFAKKSNLLVLDEPTNDLDLETLELLEDLVADYKGTVIIVSHDREFLDRVATSVLASHGNGIWVEYAGGYSDMVRQRAEASATRKVSPPPTKKVHDRTKIGATRPKLSNKDRVTLEKAPIEIERLEGLIKKLTAKISDPNVYVKNQKELVTYTRELESCERSLAILEEEWFAALTRKEAVDHASQEE